MHGGQVVTCPRLRDPGHPPAQTPPILFDQRERLVRVLRLIQPQVQFRTDRQRKRDFAHGPTTASPSPIVVAFTDRASLVRTRLIAPR